MKCDVADLNKIIQWLRRYDPFCLRYIWRCSLSIGAAVALDRAVNLDEVDNSGNAV